MLNGNNTSKLEMYSTCIAENIAPISIAPVNVAISTESLDIGNAKPQNNRIKVCRYKKRGKGHKEYRSNDVRVKQFIGRQGGSPEIAPRSINKTSNLGTQGRGSPILKFLKIQNGLHRSTTGNKVISGVSISDKFLRRGIHW